MWIVSDVFMNCFRMQQVGFMRTMSVIARKGLALRKFHKIWILFTDFAYKGKSHCEFWTRWSEYGSQITKNWDFFDRSQNLIRKTFGLSKNHKIMFQLSKLDFLEFFIGGVGIKLLDTVYISRIPIYWSNSNIFHPG